MSLTPEHFLRGANHLLSQCTKNVLLTATLLCTLLPATGQVLARPGWAGSGVAPESWWRRAVFYRIDPARFQDSDGDGIGDLPGIATRLDYLQALGIDALLLDATSDLNSPEALDDLIHEASRRHLRLLLTVSPEMQGGNRDAVLARAHAWLSAGAAGLFVPKPAPASNGSATAYPDLLKTLRALLQSFPGERVLLAEDAPQPVSLAPRPLRLTRRIDPGSFGASAGGQLTAVVPLPTATNADVAALRSSLSIAAGGTSPETLALLQLHAAPATNSPDAVTNAVVLLASRGAAMFRFGDEIGLNLNGLTPVSGADVSPSGSNTPLPVMQWTPSNQTPPAVPGGADAATATKPGGETEFGAYHPYIPPPPGSLVGTAAAPSVAVDRNVPAALPDPDTLPGFTSAALPNPPVHGAKLNTVTEDRDPRSLLNAYRQLIALHHGNATLRNGTQSLLNRDAEGALVWIRRAPAGARTVANVVVAANLSEKPVSLALDSDILALGMRPGLLRPLFSSSPSVLTGESTGHLALPPHAVFIGEIYPAGAIVSGPSAPTEHFRHGGRAGRRGGSARSRRRVRR